MKRQTMKRVMIGLGVLTLVAAGTTATAFEDRHKSIRQNSAPLKSIHASSASAKATASAPTPAKQQDVHAAPEAHGHAGPVLAPQDALKKLLDGNQRFIAGKSSGPNRSATRRGEVVKGQKPFAVIVSCSDSRVPPELLFDQGIGDLFIIRVAGNILDDVAIGSIEYAVEHLGANLIVVLGHKSCGAVSATVAGGEAPGHIGSIVGKIQPAVAMARDRHGDLLDNSIKANVKLVSQELGQSQPILKEMVEDGVIKVVGAYYDLENGAVSVTYNPCM